MARPLKRHGGVRDIRQDAEMREEQWWLQREREELYELKPQDGLTIKAQTILSSTGWIPADEMYFPAGTTILRDLLLNAPEPRVEDLVERVRALAARERPELPFSSVQSLVPGARLVWWIRSLYG